MNIARVFGFILIVIGAVLALFVRGIVKGHIKKIDAEEDDDFGELLSMSAAVFIVIGLAVIGAGVIMLLYSRL